jgi:outer membrane biosynthesis protein TonB
MEVYPVPIRAIAGFVIAIHVLLLLWILWFSPEVTAPVKPKSFAVQTVQLAPPKQQTVEMATPVNIAKPQVAVKAEPKPTPKPAPKIAPKVQPKPVAKSVAKPTAKPAPKEIAQAASPVKKGPSQESLNALKQKLAAIPGAVATKPVVAGVSTDMATGYEAELITKLKILLKLPEVGDVQVSLTLNRQGNVTKFEILSSASASNKKAVEAHLPAIRFPPFGQAYPGENTHTFKLTLTNL